MKLFGALRLPRSVIFGSGQRNTIGALATQVGQRILVCTDERLNSDVQFHSILADLKRLGATTRVYGNTQADLPIEGVFDCVKQNEAFKPDVIIGIGGGSCMDMAKAVSLVLSHPGDLRDYYGENKVPSAPLPVIAVPTTSGTGSEVTPVAVVSDTERGIKVGISSAYLIPHTAICDPELTISCPPALTACAGADALTHAIESFSALPRAAIPNLVVNNVFVGKNILSDQFAILAITNIWTSLYRAYTNGDDLEARERMMLASLAAGCSFGTAGTAAAHALQYPVGNATHTAHGVGVALLLPYVMEFNRPKCIFSFAQIGRILGVSGTDDDEISRNFIDETAQLLASIGIPRTLKDLGMPFDKQDWAAESALGASRLINNNPRSLDLDGMNQITRAAFSGDRMSLRATQSHQESLT